MNRWRLAESVFVAVGCCLVSAAAISWSSDDFLIAGSTPATIWRPALAPALSVLIVGAAALAAALAQGRVRVVLLALWLATLAVLTHRVVDGGPDGLRDLWLGVPVRSVTAYSETDEPPHGCGPAIPAQLCMTRGGRPYRVATLVPFAGALTQRRWFGGGCCPSHPGARRYGAGRISGVSQAKAPPLGSGPAAPSSQAGKRLGRHVGQGVDVHHAVVNFRFSALLPQPS